MIERVAVHPNPPNHQRWNEAEIETTTTLTWQLGKLVASLPRRDGDVVVGGGGVESSSSSSQLLELQQTKNKIDTVVVVQAQPSSKLDQVIHSFSSVLTTANNKAINTAALLKACTSHLHLMQSASNPSLSLVAKDLEQNLSKVTSFYNHHQHQCATLSSLLELERVSGIHEGNRLKEGSAAMGLLWIRRSLAFQSSFYEGLLPQESDSISTLITTSSSSSTLSSCSATSTTAIPVATVASTTTPREAANQAYNKHLSPYHGWMLRTAFPASFSQMSDLSVILSTLSSDDDTVDDIQEKEQMVLSKLRELVETLEPLLIVWREEFERLGLEDVRRV
eukprot:g1776.t1 g1776   contig11:45667-46674(-)